MMVMEYAKQGSLRKLLDSKYDELNWASKVANLYHIARRLNTIYEAKLVHKDFHSEHTQKSDIYSFGNNYVWSFYWIFSISWYSTRQRSSNTGHRHKIRCEVPQLLLDLMNKCLDADPQNRPTANKLVVWQNRIKLENWVLLDFAKHYTVLNIYAFKHLI